MLKLFKLSQLIFLIAAISIAAAWAADDGWKKIGESDGIAGYTRPTTRSGVDEIKAVGIVDASIAVVEAVIRDISIMPQSITDCKLVPKGADKTEVTYQVLGDPGGKLPHFLVSMFTKNYGIKTIAGLRQMVKKDKLKNVKKVVTTTTRIQR